MDLVQARLHRFDLFCSHLLGSIMIALCGLNEYSPYCPVTVIFSTHDVSAIASKMIIAFFIDK
jgi:hypothetical protein